MKILKTLSKSTAPTLAEIPADFAPVIRWAEEHQSAEWYAMIEADSRLDSTAKRSALNLALREQFKAGGFAFRPQFQYRKARNEHRVSMVPTVPAEN